MTQQADHGSQAEDFSQTLQNRITASRDRSAERPGDAATARERPAAGQVRKTESTPSPEARRSSEATERAEPAPPSDPSAKDSTTPAESATDSQEGEPAHQKEAGEAAADDSDIAAQPAALAAPISLPAEDAGQPALQTPYWPETPRRRSTLPMDRPKRCKTSCPPANPKVAWG